MIVFALGIESVASTNRWAISALGGLPNPIAGEPIQVGFVICQHCITPVNLGEDFGVRITLADGTTHYFSAASDGIRDHYAARVEFPSAGQYSWNIRQSYLADHDLGQIHMRASICGRNGSIRNPR